MKSVASSIINLDPDTNPLGNQPIEREKDKDRQREREKGIQDGNGSFSDACMEIKEYSTSYGGAERH